MGDHTSLDGQQPPGAYQQPTHRLTGTSPLPVGGRGFGGADGQYWSEATTPAGPVGHPRTSHHHTDVRVHRG